MKKLILFICFSLLMGMTLMAQKRAPMDEASRKKLDASKVAFITSYLDMSSEDAAKFWPVYNEYKDKSAKLRSITRSARNAKDISDADASTMLDNIVEADIEKSALRKEYYDKFRKILSDKKVLLLMEAENEFRKQMVRHYAGRKGGKSIPRKK